MSCTLKIPRSQTPQARSSRRGIQPSSCLRASRLLFKLRSDLLLAPAILFPQRPRHVVYQLPVHRSAIDLRRASPWHVRHLPIFSTFLQRLQQQLRISLFLPRHSTHQLPKLRRDRCLAKSNNPQRVADRPRLWRSRFPIHSLRHPSLASLTTRQESEQDTLTPGPVRVARRSVLPARFRVCPAQGDNTKPGSCSASRPYRAASAPAPHHPSHCNAVRTLNCAALSQK